MTATVGPFKGDVEAAYAHCRAVTRQSRSSFYAGMQMLPSETRDGIFALYAWARRVDDLADGCGERAYALAALERERDLLHGLRDGLLDQGASRDLVAVALADCVSRHEVPIEDLEEILEGCLMDVEGRHYATFEDLMVYCDRVAGAVGRAAVCVFGSSEPVLARELAGSLGRGMQLVNILRDIHEDWSKRSRVYIPTEDLELCGAYGSFGSILSDPGQEKVLQEVVALEAGRARRLLQEGSKVADHLSARSRPCVRAMATSYIRLLDAVESGSYGNGTHRGGLGRFVRLAATGLGAVAGRLGVWPLRYRSSAESAAQ